MIINKKGYDKYKGKGWGKHMYKKGSKNDRKHKPKSENSNDNDCKISAVHGNTKKAN